MPHQFNSSYQIISTTFNHIVKCINGIERIVAFYKDEDDYSIKGIGLRQQGLQMTEEVINIETSDNNQIQSFIEDCKSYKWLDKQLIPFEEKHNNSLQLNIFDEYKHLILAISLRIHNQAKGIILVYFRDDARHFGIHHSSESLSTQQKPIIAQMLWNSVSSIITETVEQNEKFALFAQNAHQIIQQHQFTNQDVESDEKRSVFILSWAEHYLEELTQYEGVNYVYSEECIKNIKSYKGTFQELQKAIGDGIEFAKTMFTYVNTKEYRIESSFIHWPVPESEVIQALDTNVNANYISQRMQKTIEFLNKLEESSLKVYHSSDNFTSANVGKNMPKPITAAAISDALSKNKERINQLFSQYPDKWEFIRNNFRPIINISAKSNYSLKNWG